MVYEIVEISTVKGTGATYLLVNFWQDKKVGKPYLINDFILGLDAHNPEAKIVSFIEDYWRTAVAHKWQGDHSAHGTEHFIVDGKIARKAGTAAKRFDCDKSDPHGVLAKVKHLEKK